MSIADYLGEPCRTRLAGAVLMKACAGMCGRPGPEEAQAAVRRLAQGNETESDRDLWRWAGPGLRMGELGQLSAWGGIDPERLADATGRGGEGQKIREAAAETRIPGMVVCKAREDIGPKTEARIRGRREAVERKGTLCWIDVDEQESRIGIPWNAIDEVEEREPPQRHQVSTWLRIGATRPERYVTGTYALNVHDPKRVGGGDWHEGVWRCPAGIPGEVPTNQSLARWKTLAKHLGMEGMRDGRPGLAAMGHPEGVGAGKVWTASHPRAIVEMQWDLVHQRMERGSPVDGASCFDEQEMEALLTRPKDYVELHGVAGRLDVAIPGEHLEAWVSWRQRMGPIGPRWDGTVWQPGPMRLAAWKAIGRITDMVGTRV